jgi:Protein of unknown function, DUF547
MANSSSLASSFSSKSAFNSVFNSASRRQFLRQSGRFTSLFIAVNAIGICQYGVLAQSTFDHSYPAWDALLKKHVRWLPDGKQSRVDYKALGADRAPLAAILADWSTLTPAAFAAFSRAQKMAFLVNAYNGFTLALIVGHVASTGTWPKSIKDLGSVFQSPWKKKFFTLLGEPRHLDWIEHEQLRPQFADPRVHAAVNCASIGCPALRDEAFTAARLDAQLDDGMRRFMGDATRNRYNPATGRMEVSAIFKWFREDFERGHHGFAKLDDVFATYAEQLSTDPAVREILSKSRTGAPVGVTFLDYDWSLNGL